MDWIKLKDIDALEKIKADSAAKPVVIFKHSTRCSISAATLSRLERSWKKEEVGDVKFYFLDLLSDRDISQQVAEDFKIGHESPQLLIISNGSCVYHSSHMSINYGEIKNQLGKVPVKN